MGHRTFTTLATLVMETDYSRPVLGATVAEQPNGQFAAAEANLFGSHESSDNRENETEPCNG